MTDSQTTRDIGGRGEQLAADLLTSKGYAIVERNAVVGRVEVDIIAQYANRIVIVEVKTRKDDHLDTNYGIDREKLLRLARAGDSYVRLKRLPHEVQIDAVLVTNHADGTSTLEHLRDITLPPLRRRR